MIKLGETETQLLHCTMSVIQQQCRNCRNFEILVIKLEYWQVSLYAMDMFLKTILQLEITQNLLPPLYAVSMGAAMFSITLVPVYPTT